MTSSARVMFLFEFRRGTSRDWHRGRLWSCLRLASIGSAGGWAMRDVVNCGADRGSRCGEVRTCLLSDLPVMRSVTRALSIWLGVLRW